MMPCRDRRKSEPARLAVGHCVVVLSVCIAGAGCGNRDSVTGDPVQALASLGAGIDFGPDGQAEFVNLSDKKLRDDDLKLLQAVPSLKRLWLYDSQITDAGLVHLSKLTNLEELVLGKNDITDEGLRRLETLTNLRELYLYETYVSDRGVFQLQQFLEKGVIVY